MKSLQEKIAVGLLTAGLASFLGGIGYTTYHACKYLQTNSEDIDTEAYHLNKAKLGSYGIFFAVPPVLSACLLLPKSRKKEE